VCATLTRRVQCTRVARHRRDIVSFGACNEWPGTLWPRDVDSTHGLKNSLASGDLTDNVARCRECVRTITSARSVRPAARFLGHSPGTSPRIGRSPAEKRSKLGEPAELAASLLVRIRSITSWEAFR